MAAELKSEANASCLTLRVINPRNKKIPRSLGNGGLILNTLLHHLESLIDQIAVGGAGVEHDALGEALHHAEAFVESSYTIATEIEG
jgi:hypothetical protein